MLSLPREARVLEQFRPAFTAPTYQRFVVLCVGAIVTMGRRSVSRILWSVRCLIERASQQLSPLLQSTPAGRCGRWPRFWRRRCWNWCPRTSR